MNCILWCCNNITSYSLIHSLMTGFVSLGSLRNTVGTRLWVIGRTYDRQNIIRKGGSWVSKDIVRWLELWEQKGGRKESAEGSTICTSLLYICSISSHPVSAIFCGPWKFLRCVFPPSSILHEMLAMLNFPAWFCKRLFCCTSETGLPGDLLSLVFVVHRPSTILHL